MLDSVLYTSRVGQGQWKIKYWTNTNFTAINQSENGAEKYEAVDHGWSKEALGIQEYWSM